MSIQFLNILTLPAYTQSVDDLFHTLMVFWENEYFLTYNLLCSFIGVKLWPIVIFTFLNIERNIRINIFTSGLRVHLPEQIQKRIYEFLLPDWNEQVSL